MMGVGGLAKDVRSHLKEDIYMYMYMYMYMYIYSDWRRSGGGEDRDGRGSEMVGGGAR